MKEIAFKLFLDEWGNRCKHILGIVCKALKLKSSPVLKNIVENSKNWKLFSVQQENAE